MQKPNSPAANKSRRVETTDENPTETLDLTALEQTPGFMVRILQIQIFEEFFEYFSSVGLSPAEHSSLITIRDNPSVLKARSQAPCESNYTTSSTSCLSWRPMA